MLRKRGIGLHLLVLLSFLFYKWKKGEAKCPLAKVQVISQARV